MGWEHPLGVRGWEEQVWDGELLGECEVWAEKKGLKNKKNGDDSEFSIRIFLLRQLRIQKI